MSEIDEAKSSPYISFDQYFTNYVIEMQDMNIDDEIEYALKSNIFDSGAVIKISSSIQKEWDKIDKCF